MFSAIYEHLNAANQCPIASQFALTTATSLIL